MIYKVSGRKRSVVEQSDVPLDKGLSIVKQNSAGVEK
jgi:hypothetical protein